MLGTGYGIASHQLGPDWRAGGTQVCVRDRVRYSFSTVEYRQQEHQWAGGSVQRSFSSVGYRWTEQAQGSILGTRYRITWMDTYITYIHAYIPVFNGPQSNPGRVKPMT